MLGNLKDFLSVVQEGLNSNSNFRQTLQEVQKVRNIFKEKQNSNVVPQTDCKVNYEAGGRLLEKYQEEWAALHANACNNAKAAEEADKTIIELHQVTKSRLRSATELANNISQIPNLTASLAECLDSLKSVQTLIKTVEDDLVLFENIVERSKMDKWKLDHQYQLTLYKEKKMAALEETRANLAKQNAEKNNELEKRQLAELQARREYSASEFQKDIAKYKASGSLPPVSPLTTVTLEQMQLHEDSTDLEKFLNS